MLNKNDLVNLINKALKENNLYFGIQVCSNDFKFVTIYSAKKKDLNVVLNYYAEAFDDELVSTCDLNTRIIGLAYGNSYEEIEKSFVKYHEEDEICQKLS